MSLFPIKKFSLPPGSALPLLVAGAFFMENLDATVIVTALPQMAKDFGVHPVDMNIGVSAYILTLTVFIPASGWIANRFGTRNIFSLAIVLFTLASILCSASVSLETFTAARMLQGFAGALMVPVGRLVVLKNTQKSDLIRAIATITWPGLVAPILGPPLGGFITTYASWHWIFFINVPLGALAIFLAWRLIPNTPTAAKQPFDIKGFIAMGVAMLCLVIGLELCSQQQVNLTYALLLLTAGGVALWMAVRHLRDAAFPMIRLSSLQVSSFRITMRGGFIFRTTISAAPFMLPLMFQVGFGLDAFHSGILVLAVFAGNLAMKPATTPLIRYFGFKKLLIGNGVLSALSLLVCAFLTPSSPEVLTMVMLFWCWLCRSMQFTGISTLAFAEVPDSEMSSANTLFSTSLQLAAGLGVTLGALSIRAGEFIARQAGLASEPGIAFRLGFVIIALITVLAVIDIARLAPDAGIAVSRKAKK